ncbi:MAG TPA: VUT family protein [Gammaproteobacteria bacterium]|nr:VUT family protein [Gammaproteobacteria bacterium]
MPLALTKNKSVFSAKPWYKRFSCTISYIILIVMINSIFVYAPYISIHGSLISSGDLVVGAVYILRDFVQREIKHYVILAMLLGCFFSYALAEKQIAIASLSAFFIGEFIDWAIYSFTQKPLSQRLLLSSGVSAPIDSAIFLYLTNMLNPVGLLALTLGKFSGIIVVWFSWRLRNRTENKTAELKTA